MTEEQILIWFAGLFEGEGTFNFDKGIAKALSISSTDKDVLDRVHQTFGGSLYPIKQRKAHWKPAWIWTIRGEISVRLATSIKPFLLQRRNSRCEEWLKSRLEVEKRISRKYIRRDKVLELNKLGWTHIKIASELGYERSSVTKILNGV